MPREAEVNGRGWCRLFGYGSFDKGMAAFIDCVRALQVRPPSASIHILSHHHTACPEL